jgi:hypothetical protein
MLLEDESLMLRPCEQLRVLPDKDADDRQQQDGSESDNSGAIDRTSGHCSSLENL